MYKYQDYKDKIDLKQFADMIIHTKKCFADNYLSGKVTLDDLLWVSGCDSWMKLACIDKLVELGYITIVENTTFHNILLTGISDYDKERKRN